MSEKFIPNSDQKFVIMAESFARYIANEPARFRVSQEDSDALSAAVKEFRLSLNACANGQRSQITTRAKERAREGAERIIRRLAQVIRVSEEVDSVSKLLLGLRERTKAKARTCPDEAPRLKFVRARHEGGSMPQHELEFRAMDRHAGKKPVGAVRLELFVDLIPPEEPIPQRPGENLGGRPWYLRSYTRSPIVLTPPIAPVAMRVVYWARWADSTGNVGPFSKTAAAWVEGTSHMAKLHPNWGGHTFEQLPQTATGPATREPHYSVAVLKVQYDYFNPQQIAAKALPEPEQSQTPQLEGPPASEAA